MKKKKKELILIISGYTCKLDRNMELYLDRAGRLINTIEFSKIILSGGHTFLRTLPEMSEAQAMADYLVPRLSKSDQKNVLLEDRSISALEKFSIIRDDYLSPNNKIYLFCDGCRGPKMALMCRIICKVWPKVITYDLTKKTSAKIKQIMKTPFDIMAIKIPSLRRREERKRLRFIKYL